jgi:hypothetical protein
MATNPSARGRYALERFHPDCSSQADIALVAVRASLLHPCGLRISTDRAAAMVGGGIRERRDGSGQAQGREGCKNKVFHRILHPFQSGGMSGFNERVDGRMSGR